MASPQPWFGLGVSVWVQIAAGNAYNFPLYSHSLKSVLGFNQRQLTLLGVANDIGENVGLLPGLVCNMVQPSTVISIGAFACFIGYGVICLALTGILSLPYAALWVALCVATNSNAWFTTAVLVTNMRNFPRSRGTVAGILKGYGGLSAAVYTEVYSVLLFSSSTFLLGGLTFVVPTLCLLLMCLVRPCTPASVEHPSEQGQFLFIQAASVVLGIYVLTTTILADLLSLSLPVTCSFLVVMVLLLMAPLAIPVKMIFYPSDRSNSALPSQDNATSAEQPLLESEIRDSALPSQDDATNAEPPLPESEIRDSALPSQDDATNAEPPLPESEISDSALPSQDNATSAEPPLPESEISESALPSQDHATSAEPPLPESEISESALPSQDHATSAEPPVPESEISYSALPSQDNATSAEPPVPESEISYSALPSQDNATSAEPPLGPSSSAASIGSFFGADITSDVNMLMAVGEGALQKKRRPRRGENFTFTEALIKADFWLLFLAYFAGVGSGVTVVNNLAQIGVADYMHDTKLLLSLFSFWNFVGRLGGGIISENIVRSRAFPRTIWMAITQAVMVATYLLFASGLDGILIVATSLLGICYGFQFSIMVPTASELFGLKNFGLIFNFISLGNPLGAYLFSNLLAGNIYDKEAARQQSSTCLGPDCFKITFHVLAGVCVVGTMLSLVLTWRIRPVYRALYAEGSFRLPRSSID